MAFTFPANCWKSRWRRSRRFLSSGAEGVTGLSLAANFRSLLSASSAGRDSGRKKITSLRRNRDLQVNIAPCYVVAGFLVSPSPFSIDALFRRETPFAR